MSWKAMIRLLSRSSSSQTKDVKAGASLFNHRILGEQHEGNECCCQSLLTVHRLFFKAPACLSPLWRRGGWLVSRHALVLFRMQGRFYTLAHIFFFYKTWLIFPFQHAHPEEFSPTHLVGWVEKITIFLEYSLLEVTNK